MHCGLVEGLLWGWWLSIIVTYTPAVVIKQGHLPLRSLCVQTAAASCNVADKLYKYEEYQPLPTHIQPRHPAAPLVQLTRIVGGIQDAVDSHLPDSNDKWL